MSLPAITEIVNPDIVTFNKLVAFFQASETRLFFRVFELMIKRNNTAFAFHVRLSGKDEDL